MKAETKSFLKSMAVLIPVGVIVLSVITVALHALNNFYPGAGAALGIVGIISLIGWVAFDIERGRLD